MIHSNKLKLFVVLGLAFLGYGIFFNSNKVEAAYIPEPCGIRDGDRHRYAGVIVDLKLKRSGKNTLEEAKGAQANITTHGPGASRQFGGNLVKLGSDGYKVDSGNEYTNRAIQRNFSQITMPAPCHSFFNTEDFTNVYLLGNGLNGSPDTSEGARNWGLDCDNSLLGGNNFQEFEFRGVGVPEGAGPGEWNTVYVAATPNGEMTNVRLTYTEYNQTPEGDLTKVSCTIARLRAYDRRSDGAISTQFRLKRINSSGNGTTEVIAPTMHNAAPTTYSDYAVDLSKAFSASNPITFILDAFDPDTGQWHEVSRKAFPSSPNPCTKDDRPTFQLGVSCEGVLISGMNDPNDRGNGVRVFGAYFNRQVNASGGTTGWSGAGSFDNVRVSGTDGSVFIPWPYGNPGSDWSNGWSIHVGAYNINKDGQDNQLAAYYSAEANGSCYQASCTVDIASSPGLPADSVKANNPFSVTANFSNPAVNIPVAVYKHPENPTNSTGQYQLAGTATTPNLPLPDSLGEGQLVALDGGGGFDFNPIDYFMDGAATVPRGGTSTREFSLTAPAGISEPEVNLYPAYENKIALGGRCAKKANVFQPFKLTPNAGLPIATPNEEDPEKITYTGGVNQQVTGTFDNANYYTSPIPGVNVSTSLVYIDGHNGASPPSDSPPDLHKATFSGNFGNVTKGESDGLVFNDVTPGPQFRPGNQWQPGDKFCGRTVVDLSRGWIGPNNVLANVTQDPAAQSCKTVLNHPYTRVYGADVMGGGSFGQMGGTGGIQAYMEDGPSGAGSGAEFAAIAINTIDGFATASLRTINPTPSRGLAFANMGGNSFATPDYFAASLKTDTPDSGNLPTLSTVGLANDKQTLIKKTGTGKLQLSGNPTFSGHHAVFVEGDVVINGDIAYANTGNYATVEAIPAFDLIVKGNIYIANTVGRLDGTYTAQPNNAGNGGKIFTCAKSGDQTVQTYTEGDLYTMCKDKQLIVNGAFVAQDLKLLRTYKTLRDIPYSEPSIGNRTYKRETFGDDYAAESFRMSPDYFMAKRALKPEGSQANGKFDYYVTLPPVL